MSSTYTQLLGRVQGEGTGIAQLFIVPEGQLYVVRNIDVYYTGPALLYLQGFQVQVNEQVTIFGAGPPYARINKPYSWEGRQAMNPGDGLFLVSNDASWQCSVTGYVFNNPVRSGGSAARSLSRG